MSAVKTLSTITLDVGSSTSDYPRAYQVFVSADGHTWGNPVASGVGRSALMTISSPSSERPLHEDCPDRKDRELLVGRLQG